MTNTNNHCIKRVPDWFDGAAYLRYLHSIVSNLDGWEDACNDYADAVDEVRLVLKDSDLPQGTRADLLRICDSSIDRLIAVHNAANGASGEVAALACELEAHLPKTMPSDHVPHVAKAASHDDGHKPPTPHELASIKFEDELGTALANIRGAAYLLGSCAEELDEGNAYHAIYLLSTSLYETADSLDSTHAAMLSQRESSHAIFDSPRHPMSASARIVADTAHVDALTARTALDRIAAMVVSGELDLSTEADTDAFSTSIRGIAETMNDVAEALDTLLHRAEDTVH